METLDRSLLAMVKKGFVGADQMDPAMGAGPVAGGGMLTQAQASPMGGTPQGMPMDPNAMGGAPMDPAAMGGAPMDPNAMGGQVDPNTGMPMDPNAMGGAPMDPAMGGAVDPAAAGAPPDLAAMAAQQGQIVMSPAEFVEVINAVRGSSGGAADGGKPAEKGGKVSTAAKLDQILAAVSGQPAAAPQQ